MQIQPSETTSSISLPLRFYYEGADSRWASSAEEIRMLRKLVLAYCLCAISGLSASLTVGALSVLEGNPIEGQFSFGVLNSTGPNEGCNASLGLEACTAVTFLNTTLDVTYVLNSIQTTAQFLLGDLGPGLVFTTGQGNEPTAIVGADSILSVVFSATMSTAEILLTDNSTKTYATAVSGILTNPSANNPESQNTLLTVTEAEVNPIPEPSTLLVFASGLIALAYRRRH